MSRPIGWLYTWQEQAEGSHLLQLMKQMEVDHTEMDFLDGQIKKTSAHGVAPAFVLHAQQQICTAMLCRMCTAHDADAALHTIMHSKARLCLSM